MTQLRSCYFCGTVGDSLQEYEVVPERFVSAGGARSAVLCSTCHEKLRHVIEPLAAALESSTTTPEDVGASSVQEVTFESDAGTGAPDARTSDSGTGDGTASRPASETSADAAPATPEQGEATGRAVDDGPAATDVDETASEDASETASEDASEDLPDQYYKVLRLLQNREFPMERADLTTLVTGAYDVSTTECDRIIETAIDRDVLVERGSTLDRGGR